MKKSLALALLFIMGCSTAQTDQHVINIYRKISPPVKTKRAIFLSPRAAQTFALPPHKARHVLGAGVPAAPSWTFTNGINGKYKIEASTNLLDWWTVAVVFDTTNITVTSDTVHKRTSLFYRVLPF